MLHVLLIAAATAVAEPMMTEWGRAVTPANAWREYPRPQLRRADWQCLNGEWDFAIVSNVHRHATEIACGKILVPFPFESALSGVGRLVEPHETMIYRRTFTAEPKAEKRLLLNFEGVDWRTQVFVNGIEATDVPHENGSLPFTVDVSDFIRRGENDLEVWVWDPTSDFVISGGKQDLKPEGCFYTRASGIHQTVWLEEVPRTYVAGYRLVTDCDRGEVRLKLELAHGRGDERARIEIFASTGECVAHGEGAAAAELTVPMPADFRRWSPASPALYTFRAVCGDDSFSGYFGMRKIERARDARGEWRFMLNGEAIFPLGTLDQGWWPDGLTTPPSLAACEHELKTLKACGFNLIRKHIKLENRLYYELCDRLGMLVFQDASSMCGVGNFRDPPKVLAHYGMARRELKGQIDLLFNIPSIVMWIPFNESWGQPNAELTAATLRWTKRYDPTRLVGGPSGWDDFEGGFSLDKLAVRPESADPAADTVDLHSYPHPAQASNHVHRISMLGEFGGLGLRVPGHLWQGAKCWGYGETGKAETSQAEIEAGYLKLMDELAGEAERGLAAAVYTQTSDVEGEINGLFTYDRAVFKFDIEKLRAAHKKVYERAADAAPPTAEKEFQAENENATISQSANEPINRPVGKPKN